MHVTFAFFFRSGPFLHIVGSNSSCIRGEFYFDELSGDKDKLFFFFTQVTVFYASGSIFLGASLTCIDPKCSKFF